MRERGRKDQCIRERDGARERASARESERARERERESAREQESERARESFDVTIPMPPMHNPHRQFESFFIFICWKQDIGAVLQVYNVKIVKPEHLGPAPASAGASGAAGGAGT